MLSIIKNDNITSEHNSFYFELSMKQNIDIYGITVYMQKKMSLKQSSSIIMTRIFNMEVAMDLGIEKEHTLWE